MMFDTHCHLFSSEFDEDREAVVMRALDAGVDKMMLANIDEASIAGMLALHNQYPQNCLASIGLHPTSVGADFQSVLDHIYMEYLAKDENHVYKAIGETGLDYYWDLTYVEQQVQALKTQIGWAKKHQLPLILHTRASIDETISILQNEHNPDLKGVFHCFSGNLKQAETIIEMGFFLGIGGTITYRNNDLRHFIKKLPLESILLETDAPYLSPKPFRGQRNESSYLPYIRDEVAHLMDMIPDLVEDQTTKNAQSLFLS